MTCFWDGILKSLKKDDLDFVNYKDKKSPVQFIRFLKIIVNEWKMFYGKIKH